MSGGDDAASVKLDPQEAFGLFGHELRLEILLALWDAPNFALPFTELRERVGERDSGKFTYHLSKLEDQFVRHVDDRYVLQYAGHRIIDAVRSGVFHESPEIPPTEVDGSCTGCGTPPRFSYESHVATVSCSECDSKLIEYPFDPGGFRDRTIEEAASAFDRRTKYMLRLASGGVCFVCAGRVTPSFTDSPPEFEHMDRYDDFFAADHPAVVELTCRNCSFYSYVPAGVRLLDHPAVAGRLHDGGIDLRERPLWSLPFVTQAECVTVRSRDPWEVLVETSALGGTIEVRLDDDVTIQSVTVSV